MQATPNCQRTQEASARWPSYAPFGPSVERADVQPLPAVSAGEQLCCLGERKAVFYGKVDHGVSSELIRKKAAPGRNGSVWGQPVRICGALLAPVRCGAAASKSLTARCALSECSLSNSCVGFVAELWIARSADLVHHLLGVGLTQRGIPLRHGDVAVAEHGLSGIQPELVADARGDSVANQVGRPEVHPRLLARA